MISTVTATIRNSQIHRRISARRTGALSRMDVRRQGNLVGFCVVAIVVGAGSYGAVMGSWRDPLQALYTGIKLPLVILLTTLGNGLLNGMLAPLLGLNVTFRQSLAVVLMSFAIDRDGFGRVKSGGAVHRLEHAAVDGRDHIDLRRNMAFCN